MGTSKRNIRMDTFFWNIYCHQSEGDDYHIHHAGVRKCTESLQHTSHFLCLLILCNFRKRKQLSAKQMKPDGSKTPVLHILPMLGDPTEQSPATIQSPLLPVPRGPKTHTDTKHKQQLPVVSPGPSCWWMGRGRWFGGGVWCSVLCPCITFCYLICTGQRQDRRVYSTSPSLD